MPELQYFEFKGIRGGKLSTIRALYALKLEHMTLQRDGKQRHLYVILFEDGRVVINQTKQPSNPAIPMEALLEFPSLVQHFQAAAEERRNKVNADAIQN